MCSCFWAVCLCWNAYACVFQCKRCPWSTMYGTRILAVAAKHLEISVLRALFFCGSPIWWCANSEEVAQRACSSQAITPHTLPHVSMPHQSLHTSSGRKPRPCTASHPPAHPFHLTLSHTPLLWQCTQPLPPTRCRAILPSLTPPPFGSPTS